MLLPERWGGLYRDGDPQSVVILRDCILHVWLHNEVVPSTVFLLPFYHPCAANDLGFDC